MSLRNIVDEYGAKICAEYKGGIYAEFAPAEETVGFISTSEVGARGIAFMCDKLRVNLDGAIMQAEYAAIDAVEILDSGEGAYADELVIKAGGESLRISDYSLEKRELKALIEELCKASKVMSDKERDRLYSEAMIMAAEHFSQAAPFFEPPKPEIEKRSAAIPAGYTPAQITEERIDWISGPSHSAETSQAGPATAEREVSEMSAEPPLMMAESFEQTEPPVIPETVSEIEDELGDEDISEMTHEQTLSYLLNSINEINAPPAQVVQETPVVQHIPAAQDAPVAQVAPVAPMLSEIEEKPAVAAYTETQQAVQNIQASLRNGLSVEPASDDIYIKASRILREYCEHGTLTQEGIEAAVKEGLVPAAEMFMDVMSQTSEITQALSERIDELKTASDRIDNYFALGEDAAARVMFFMLYQMLSYADRLAERPETKQRLNDFFKRWGAAGITLSMLDMRVQ